MQILTQLQASLSTLKAKLPEINIYGFGSYALNRLTPKKSFSCMTNVAYGLKARQRLDLYYATVQRVDRALLVFVHGGAWQTGDKKDYLFLAESFCREGFDVAIINYQLAPEHLFPEYVHDLALAVNFLHDLQQKLNICTNKIVLMGHSAGAFNVMSLLYHPQPIVLNCMPNIRAVLGLAGPYHFNYVRDRLAQDAFDCTIAYQQVMPNYFVRSNRIKHYLLVAENDTTVGAYNSTDMQHALLKQGNHSEIAVIPRVGHIAIVASLSIFMSRYFATKRMVMSLMNEALQD